MMKHHHLVYAERPAFRDRRISRQMRRVVWLSLLAAGMIFWCCTQGLCLLRQSWARREVLPHDLVVYDDDPIQVSKLRNDRRYAMLLAKGERPPGAVAAAYGDTAFSRVEQYARFDITVLCRRSAAVSERLVRVYPLGPAVTADGYDLQLAAESMIGASAIPFARCDVDGNAACELHVPKGSRLRIFAGQPDPQDDSHFSFRYELGGEPGLIEGWLLHNGGNGLMLRVTTGPARQGG